MTWLSVTRGGCSLRRMVRRLVGLLLGERNAINLYDEDDTAKRFEAEAKRIGATVMACDFKSGHNPFLERVIYPLADSEDEQGKRQQDKVSLRDGFRLDGDSGNKPGSTSHGKGVPPVVYLKPGERITHVMVMRSPNEKS